MKILINVEQPNQLRPLEQSLRTMAGRGDRICIVSDRYGSKGVPKAWMVGLSNECPNISFLLGPSAVSGGRWAVLIDRLRPAINFLGYQEPPFSDAPKLVRRMEDLSPPAVVRLAKLPLVGRRGRRLLRRLIEAVIRSAPIHPEIEALIRDAQPDLVMVFPRQPDTILHEYVRAGRRLGVRTGFCVRSWDNLTMKGLIQETPDLVCVWNEGQKREAVELHGVPAERVQLTGAPGFDHWFDWQPSTTRAQWCESHGLDPARPFLLYLGSSRGVIGPFEREAEFLARWITELRSRAEPQLRSAQIVLRPHPGAHEPDHKKWKHVLKGLDENVAEGVVLWSVIGKPIKPKLQSQFFDAIHHSAGVVGLNTSAMIESAIVGRSVYTLIVPELHDSQQGLLHFSLMSEFAGGVLHIGHDFDQHAAQLAASLDGSTDASGAERRRHFVEAFVRPRGIDKPAAQAFVEAIDEGSAGADPKPQRPPFWASPVRALSSPLAYRLRG